MLSRELSGTAGEGCWCLVQAAGRSGAKPCLSSALCEVLMPWLAAGVKGEPQFTFLVDLGGFGRTPLSCPSACVLG